MKIAVKTEEEHKFKVVMIRNWCPTTDPITTKILQKSVLKKPQQFLL